jgi:hypothetical protein
MQCCGAGVLDPDEAAREALATRDEQRERVRMLDVADWDCDGWAAEFVLQLGAGACGERRGPLLGVSGRSSASSGPLRIVSSRCGDNGSGFQLSTC